MPAFERLQRCQGVDDNRVEPLVALPGIMVCPFDWIGRDELWRVPLRDGRARYAKQLRSSAAPASARTVRRLSASPLAARPSIKAWNTRCIQLQKFHDYFDPAAGGT